MNLHRLSLFILAISCVLFPGCHDKKADDGTPLFSKGVTKVFSAERILECKAHIEIGEHEDGVARIKGHADELGDFDALAMFASGTDTPALDRNKLYDIVVYQNFRGGFDNSIDNRMSPRDINEDGSTSPIREPVDWSNEILIIKDGGNIILDRSICALHKCAMDFVQVRISYGLPGPELNKLYEMAAKRFPNGLDFTLGGCVVMSGSPKVKRKFVCQECAEEYRKWQQEEYEKKKAAAAH